MKNLEQFDDELNNHLLEMGWKQGAATTDRLERLVNRLSTEHKLRLAAVAIADTDLDDYSQSDFELAS